MANRIATREHVVEACELLGQSATGRNVRAVLGGGSMRDIMPLVTEWKARGAAAAASGKFNFSQPSSIHLLLMRLDQTTRQLVERLKHIEACIAAIDPGKDATQKHSALGE